MEATYNITDDKLRASFDGRLSETDYKAIKAAGFSYWRGSKLFVSKWSVTAEDYLLGLGFEITDDDEPDNVEARLIGSQVMPAMRKPPQNRPAITRTAWWKGFQRDSRS